MPREKKAPKKMRIALAGGSLDDVVALLNSHCNDALSLHCYLNHAMPTIPDPVPLSDEASLSWAADLAENIATNNSNVRTAIRDHDTIVEQEIWPDPKPIIVKEVNEFFTAISQWLQINDALFGSLLELFYLKSLYDGPIQTNPPNPCKCIHDVLYRLAVNAVEFIKAQNNVAYPRGYKWDPIDIEDIPDAPAENVKHDNYQSLRRLERAIHKLVQDRMQIVTFVPAHLRWVVSHVGRLK